MNSLPLIALITLITGNNAVAVIKGQESYEVLQSSCSAIFQQVHNVIDRGKVSVEGKDVPVDAFLGGDYKVYKS